MNFEKLKELILNNNHIPEITVLERVKFENLKELYLSDNKISDIKVLEKAKFKNLEKLDLNNNQISDMKILEKIKNQILKKLDLNNNKISDIKNLEKVNKKVDELQNLNKPQISQVNNISQNERITELEEEVRKLRTYFLSPGEELMTLKIVSNDQTMKFSTFCKPNDKFSKIEDIISNKYPNYSEVDNDNFFLANGQKINRYKTLAENGIQNNDVLTCIINNDDI